MRRNKLSICVLFLMITISLYGCGNNNDAKQTSSTTPEDVYVSAKTDSYVSVEELEQASDLIVIGSKIKEIDSNVKYDENGVYQIAYTYSEFKIDEIIDNKVNETRKNITIFENQALDKQENEILHIAGYINMIVDNQYVLYLELADEGYYIPLAATAGKIALSKSEVNSSKIKMRNFDNEATKEIEGLHQKVQDKYRDKIK